MILIIKATNFLPLKKILGRLKNDICINVFCYENNLVYPVYVSNQKFENCMDLLLITDENKSISLMCNKTKNKNKNHIYKYFLQCFSSENVLHEHRETSLKINGKQSVKLRRGSIKFKNSFKQLADPFKIYADFESVLIGVRGNDRKK